MEFCTSICAPLLSCFVTGYHWEKSGSIFHTAPTPGIYMHLEDPPESSLLQAGQSQLSPLLVWWMHQGLNCPGGPWLDSVHVCLTQGSQNQTAPDGPEQRGRIISLNMVQCPAQHLPPSAQGTHHCLRSNLPGLTWAWAVWHCSRKGEMSLFFMLPLLSDPNLVMDLMYLFINYHVQSIQDLHK